MAGRASADGGRSRLPRGATRHVIKLKDWLAGTFGATRPDDPRRRQHARLTSPSRRCWSRCLRADYDVTAAERRHVLDSIRETARPRGGGVRRVARRLPSGRSTAPTTCTSSRRSSTGCCPTRRSCSCSSSCGGSRRPTTSCTATRSTSSAGSRTCCTSPTGIHRREAALDRRLSRRTAGPASGGAFAACAYGGVTLAELAQDRPLRRRLASPRQQVRGARRTIEPEAARRPACGVARGQPRRRVRRPGRACAARLRIGGQKLGQQRSARPACAAQPGCMALTMPPGRSAASNCASTG